MTTMVENQHRLISIRFFFLNFVKGFVVVYYQLLLFIFFSVLFAALEEVQGRGEGS